MDCQIYNRFSTAEIQIDADTLIRLTKDESGLYILVVASPGARIAAVRISGISQLQLRQLAGEIVRIV